MFRYFAFASAAAPLSSSAAHELIWRLTSTNPEWRLALRQERLRVYCTGEKRGRVEAQLLANNQGVILGTIFERPRQLNHDTVPRRAKFEPMATNDIVASQGRSLTRDYWGNYVAFVTIDDCQSLRVVRAPVGVLPCLRVEHESIVLYFSFMDDCARLLDRNFSINWNYLARSLLAPAQSGETGLNEVSEVLAGECEVLGDAGSGRRTYWDPLQVWSAEPILDPQRAAQELQVAIQSSVNAWAALHDNILHFLSGGLDSSIVLSCLTSAPSRPHVTCVNDYGDAFESDERRYAQLVARQCGARLIERKATPNGDLSTLLDVPRFERPTFHIKEVSRANADLALELGASAMSFGHGGDELFCRHHTRYYVSDFIAERGIRPELLDLLLDSAVKDKLSIWRVLHSALRSVVLRRQWSVLREQCEEAEGKLMIADGAIRRLYEDHSFDLPRGQSRPFAPTGKLWQIFLVTARREYYDPFELPSDPVQLSPLLSQPVAEVCLRIPTYLQVRGRVDRSVARHAFSSVLPQEVVWRRSKGGVEDYMAEVQRRNLGFARSLLVDGLLVRHGVADGEALRSALGDAPSDATRGTASVFFLLATEAWLRSWTDTTRRQGTSQRASANL